MQNANGKSEDEMQKVEKEVLDEILPEAFAAVREASKRTLGQRHFDVQIMGGAVLHNGNIAEMSTGEGKTLVATLPVYLNALTGRGVHVVTVNDYLSRRDAVWMGQIYNALGLSVGVINHESSFIYDPKHKSAQADTSLGELRGEPSGRELGLRNRGIARRENVSAGALSKEDPLVKEVDQIGAFHVVHEFLRPCTTSGSVQCRHHLWHEQRIRL